MAQFCIFCSAQFRRASVVFISPLNLGCSSNSTLFCARFFWRGSERSSGPWSQTNSRCLQQHQFTSSPLSQFWACSSRSLKFQSAAAIHGKWARNEVWGSTIFIVCITSLITFTHMCSRLEDLREMLRTPHSAQSDRSTGNVRAGHKEERNGGGRSSRRSRSRSPVRISSTPTSSVYNMSLRDRNSGGGEVYSTSGNYVRPYTTAMTIPSYPPMYMMPAPAIHARPIGMMIHNPNPLAPTLLNMVCNWHQTMVLFLVHIYHRKNPLFSYIYVC